MVGRTGLKTNPPLKEIRSICARSLRDVKLSPQVSHWVLNRLPTFYVPLKFQSITKFRFSPRIPIVLMILTSKERKICRDGASASVRPQFFPSVWILAQDIPTHTLYTNNATQQFQVFHCCFNLNGAQTFHFKSHLATAASAPFWTLLIVYKLLQVCPAPTLVEITLPSHVFWLWLHAMTSILNMNGIRIAPITPQHFSFGLLNSSNLLTHMHAAINKRFILSINGADKWIPYLRGKTQNLQLRRPICTAYFTCYALHINCDRSSYTLHDHAWFWWRHFLTYQHEKLTTPATEQ